MGRKNHSRDAHQHSTYKENINRFIIYDCNLSQKGRKSQADHRAEGPTNIFSETSFEKLNKI